MIKYAANLIFTLSGWKFKNSIPSDLTSFVMIGAPHTSNHDFIPAMTLAHKIKLNSSFIIKNEWLNIPILGSFLKSMGAIGLDRKKINDSGPNNTTELYAEYFNKFTNFVLMISPEGTRKANPHWKSGFYYIAKKANVPIVFGYADYKNKVAGLGGYLYPSDFAKDMETISKFYENIQGKHPQQFAKFIDKKRGNA